MRLELDAGVIRQAVDDANVGRLLQIIVHAAAARRDARPGGDIELKISTECGEAVLAICEVPRVDVDDQVARAEPDADVRAVAYCFLHDGRAVVGGRCPCGVARPLSLLATPGVLCVPPVQRDQLVTSPD